MLLAVAAAHFDAAFEHGAIFHADAHRGNVSCNRAFAADIDAIAAFNVSAHLAHNHNFAGGDIRLHAAVSANGNAIIGQADLAFDAAVNVERFRAAEFAFNYERAANGRPALPAR